MKTKIQKISPKQPKANELQLPLSLLKKGEIIAFPTETVYGLGANSALPSAIERLYQLKKRKNTKPSTLMISGFDMLERFIPQLPMAAQKVTKVYWPGPLTIVVPNPQGSFSGFRVPGTEFARQLIAALGEPLIAPSANPAGQPPACNAKQVLDYYQNQIPLLLDGGTTPLQQASSVVKFLPNGEWEILREGIITKSMIKKLVSLHILFVCSENTCRSPIAVAILKNLLAERLGVPQEYLEHCGFYINSAGIYAKFGQIANPKALLALEEKNAKSLTLHRTRPLTRRMVERADMIYVMTGKHFQILSQKFPEAKSKIYMLHPNGIEDPYGDDPNDIASYKKCAQQIHQALLDILNKICPAKLSQLKI